MDAGKTALICWIMFACVRSFTSADQKNLTAQSGQKNVTLTCQAPNSNIIVVEWSRADLGDEYVLLYRNEQFDPVKQHPSFKNRVDLQDRQMKDGDVSLILKNVTSADNGTYMCCIVMAATTSCDPISITSLRVVDPPGQTGGHTEDGSFGLKVGLPVGVIVAVVGGGVFLIYRKLKPQSQGSYQPPAAQQPV